LQKPLTTRTSTDTKKSRPLNIPQATMEFLEILLAPAQLSHKADHADFIRNAVLADLLTSIRRCDQKGGY
jgi:hypothetical protein